MEEVHASSGPDAGGLSRYYQSKLDELELIIREKSNNLRRLEAQRSALNTKGEWTRRGRRCAPRARTHRATPHPATPPSRTPCAVRNLREELVLLQEPASQVGEVVKAMGKNKVLVKVRGGTDEERRSVRPQMCPPRL